MTFGLNGVYDLIFVYVNKVNLLSLEFNSQFIPTKLILKDNILHYSPPQRLTAVLALATLISAFGSSFQYGYNVAVINSPAPVTMANTRKMPGRIFFQIYTR